MMKGPMFQMYEKISAKIWRDVDKGFHVDPSMFDDPVAMQTDWTPAKFGGAHFGTHKLVESNPDRLEFRASIWAKLYYIFFLGMEIAVVVLIVFFGLLSLGSYTDWYPADWGHIITIGAGVACTIVGACMYYFGTAPIVFDRRRGFFWKGRKHPDHVFDKGTLKHFAKLEKVYALQIISELVGGQTKGHQSYTSYELNLVLEDGKRITVIDHGNKDRLRKDADTLAAFLDKPVWKLGVPEGGIYRLGEDVDAVLADIQAGDDYTYPDLP